MHETLCFSIQSPSPNLDDLPLRCDGCETVSCVVGSCSDRSRIGLGSVPHCKWGFNCFSSMCGRQNSIVICNCRIVPAMQMGLQVVLVDELPMEFHCDLQLQDPSRNVNGIASVAGG